MLKKAFKAAWSKTIPIMAGFLFLGFSYGVYMNGLYNKCWGKQAEPTKKTRKKVEHIWKETVKMEMSRYHKRRLQYAL